MTTDPGTLLVVEDEESLRVALVDNLEDEGFVVHATHCGQAGLTMARTHRYDVILLDIMLPDIDGYTLCRKLRGQGIDSAVLMLTARTLEDDIVAGFEAGADDYLAKPYRLRELLARVRALLRRRGKLVQAAPDLDGILIDRSARTVTLPDGTRPELTRTEFNLLVYMFERSGQALSRATLLEDVWSDTVVDPRTIDNFISSLKRKLNWSKDRKFAFRAVRGVGYRLEIDT